MDFSRIRNMVREELIRLEEIRNKDFVKSMLEKAGKEEWYDRILELDPTSGRNAVYSVKLVKFFLEPRSSSDENMYELLDRYMKLFLVFKTRNLLSGKEADLNSYRKFDNFHNVIDRIATKLKRESEKGVDILGGLRSGKVEEPQGNRIEVMGKQIDKGDITYMDENVVVVRADNMAKSKAYGGGFSDWCTARKSGNLFYTYRLDNEETLYYVYMLQKERNDLESVLHFGIDEEGNISYTDRSNEESERDLGWLVRKFPELKPAVDADAFEYVPLTDAEAKLVEMDDYISPEDFSRMEYLHKEMWLQSGDRNIDLRIWNMMDDNLKNQYVRDFEDREDDIQGNIKVALTGTKYERIYWDAIQDRVIDNLEEGEQSYYHLQGDDLEVIIKRNLIDVLSRYYLSSDENISNLTMGGMPRESILKAFHLKLERGQGYVPSYTMKLSDNPKEEFYYWLEKSRKYAMKSEELYEALNMLPEDDRHQAFLDLLKKGYSKVSEEGHGNFWIRHDHIERLLLTFSNNKDWLVENLMRYGAIRESHTLEQVLREVPDRADMLLNIYIYQVLGQTNKKKMPILMADAFLLYASDREKVIRYTDFFGEYWQNSAIAADKIFNTMITSLRAKPNIEALDAAFDAYIMAYGRFQLDDRIVARLIDLTGDKIWALDKLMAGHITLSGYAIEQIVGNVDDKEKIIKHIVDSGNINERNIRGLFKFSENRDELVDYIIEMVEPRRWEEWKYLLLFSKNKKEMAVKMVHKGVSLGTVGEERVMHELMLAPDTDEFIRQKINQGGKYEFGLPVFLVMVSDTGKLLQWMDQSAWDNFSGLVTFGSILEYNTSFNVDEILTEIGQSNIHLTPNDTTILTNWVEKNKYKEPIVSNRSSGHAKAFMDVYKHGVKVAKDNIFAILSSHAEELTPEFVKTLYVRYILDMGVHSYNTLFNMIFKRVENKPESIRALVDGFVSVADYLNSKVTEVRGLYMGDIFLIASKHGMAGEIFDKFIKSGMKWDQDSWDRMAAEYNPKVAGTFMKSIIQAISSGVDLGVSFLIKFVARAVDIAAVATDENKELTDRLVEKILNNGILPKIKEGDYKYSFATFFFLNNHLTGIRKPTPRLEKFKDQYNQLMADNILFMGTFDQLNKNFAFLHSLGYSSNRPAAIKRIVNMFMNKSQLRGSIIEMIYHNTKYDPTDDFIKSGIVDDPEKMKMVYQAAFKYGGQDATRKLALYQANKAEREQEKKKQELPESEIAFKNMAKSFL